MRRTIFNEDHDAFRESCRTFVDRTLRPRHEKHIASHEFGREVWLELGRQDSGLNVPEEYGGAGVNDSVLTDLGRRTIPAGVFLPVVCRHPHQLHRAISSRPVHRGTEAALAARVLQRRLDHRARYDRGFGGSDLAALKTRAVPDGEDWILNGSKTFITNGASADFVLVAARTSPEKGAKGITLFAVEAGMPGFERGRKLDKVGLPESDISELFFDDVRVPAANVIGEIDQGFGYMMQRLVAERIGSAVNNISHARQILDETLVYAKERKAFGTAIGSFQANKFTLAELQTLAEVTQAFVDQCVMEAVHGTLTAVDAAKAKWWSAQAQNDILDACVQLWGGYGYMNEYRVARAWADARPSKIWAGSNEIMKELIGRDLGL